MRSCRCERDGERRAAALLARDRDGAAVKPHQLLHQRQPDARALVRARPRVLHAMEALEHPRQIRLGDPDAGVADAELDTVAVPRERDA